MTLNKALFLFDLHVIPRRSPSAWTVEWIIRKLLSTTRIQQRISVFAERSFHEHLIAKWRRIADSKASLLIGPPWTTSSSAITMAGAIGRSGRQIRSSGRTPWVSTSSRFPQRPFLAAWEASPRSCPQVSPIGSFKNTRILTVFLLLHIKVSPKRCFRFLLGGGSGSARPNWRQI